MVGDMACFLRWERRPRFFMDLRVDLEKIWPPFALSGLRRGLLDDIELVQGKQTTTFSFDTKKSKKSNFTLCY